MTNAHARVALNETDFAEGDAVLRHPTGLHARPAVKLTKLAKSFESVIEIRTGRADQWINAKSPNAVMKLKAENGETIHFRARGMDSSSAVEALVSLVEQDFV